MGSKLWKSEAIDSFGMRYLLGIYENKEDAQKAFDAWNAEYEKARADSVEELAQWSKTEQAKLDADTDNQEAIKAIFETAKSMQSSWRADRCPSRPSPAGGYEGAANPQSAISIHFSSYCHSGGHSGAFALARLVHR